MKRAALAARYAHVPWVRPRAADWCDVVGQPIQASSARSPFREATGVALCLLGLVLRLPEVLFLGVGLGLKRSREACFALAVRLDPSPPDPPVGPDDGRE